MTTVYFAHGKESGPWGRKIVALAAVARAAGYAVESPDYSFTQDPDERLRHLHELQPPTGRDLVLVGSSMGGYVAANAARELAPAGVFLLAPALYMARYPVVPGPIKAPVSLVHGWRDDIVPPQNSWYFAETHHAHLTLLDDEHTLNASLPVIEPLFAAFLEQVAASQT